MERDNRGPSALGRYCLLCSLSLLCISCLPLRPRCLANAATATTAGQKRMHCSETQPCFYAMKWLVRRPSMALCGMAMALCGWRPKVQTISQPGRDPLASSSHHLVPSCSRAFILCGEPGNHRAQLHAALMSYYCILLWSFAILCVVMAGESMARNVRREAISDCQYSDMVKSG